MKTRELPQKMIEAVYSNAEIDSGMLDDFTSCSGISNAEEIAQGVINAAWSKYDPEDERTWPDKPEPDSNRLWLTITGGERLAFQLWTGRSFELMPTTHYADPVSIMPEVHK